MGETPEVQKVHIWQSSYPNNPDPTLSAMQVVSSASNSSSEESASRVTSMCDASFYIWQEC